MKLRIVCISLGLIAITLPTGASAQRDELNPDSCVTIAVSATQCVKDEYGFDGNRNAGGQYWNIKLDELADGKVAIRKEEDPEMSIAVEMTITKDQIINTTSKYTPKIERLRPAIAALSGPLGKFAHIDTGVVCSTDADVGNVSLTIAMYPCKPRP